MKLSLPFFVLLTMFSCQTQPQADDSDTVERLQAIEDKMAIKAVVDRFSILADEKDVSAQLLLFTEDAVVRNITAGQPASELTGHKEIGEAFTNFLSLFSTVYHANGQQLIELAGDKATATSYCQVILISEEDSKPVKTSLWVRYHDEFVRRNGEWLIARRTSNFDHREREVLPSPTEG